jgi:hypothetical protein
MELMGIKRKKRGTIATPYIGCMRRMPAGGIF